MRASDVVLQLAALLPKFTDLFTDNISVVSLSLSANTVTATTAAPHSLSVSSAVNIQGAQTPVTISSFTRVGTIGTIITDSDHDFTFGNNGAISGSGLNDANVSGANEAEFNGAFQITGIPNRRTIQVDMTDIGPASATGLPILENGASLLQTYNGIHEVLSTPTATTFTYDISSSGILDPVGVIQAKTNARITAVNSVDEIISAYTEQVPNSLWAFVVTGDTVASKNRKIFSDASDNTQRSNYFRQQLIQTATIYIVFPTAVQEIAGRRSRDVAEELFRPICQSILFSKFNSLLFSEKNNPLQFLSHGFTANSSAFYIHQYSFEQVADLLFEDTVGLDDDVAFRDVILEMGVDVGVGKLTANIDLDEEPLP